MTVYWPNGSLTIPTVTSEYNPARKNPVTGFIQSHRGIDLVGFKDNCSPVDGTVILAGYNGPAGNEVRIRADGPTAFHAGDVFRILHNAVLYVSIGQRVSARQPVGRMGTTGQSTGIHCHYETHERAVWNIVNPRDFMARANAAAVTGSAASSAGNAGSPAGSESDDMPLDNNDVQRVALAVLQATFKTGRKNPDGTDEEVPLYRALSATYFYGDRFERRIPAGSAIPRVDGDGKTTPYRALDNGDGAAIADLIRGVDARVTKITTPTLDAAALDRIAEKVAAKIGGSIADLVADKLATRLTS